MEKLRSVPCSEFVGICSDSKEAVTIIFLMKGEMVQDCEVVTRLLNTDKGGKRICRIASCAFSYHSSSLMLFLPCNVFMFLLPRLYLLCS